VASTERLERGPELFREELGLFPRREMTAFVDLVVIDEIGVRPLGPAPWSLILLAREDGNRYRNGDALGVKKPPLYSQ
jgi:hypothetical protein